MADDCFVRDDIVFELSLEPGIDTDCVQVSVTEGVVTLTGQVVTLTGEVEWEFQKALIERTVRQQANVIGVSNLMKVHRYSSAGDHRQGAKSAYHQLAELEASGVKIAIDGVVATLSGRARSPAARREAESAAWGISRISRLVDQLVIA